MWKNRHIDTQLRAYNIIGNIVIHADKNALLRDFAREAIWK